jgi:protein-arginine kinase activator protein McsA
MKQVGICEHCSKAGALETVEVTEVGKSSPVIQLRLCARCAVEPNAVWRRRYQPVQAAAGRSPY